MRRHAACSACGVGGPACPVHGWDRVQGDAEHHAVVAVGPAQGYAEWRVAGVGAKVAHRARLAPVCGVWTRCRSSLFAGTDVMSSVARLQPNCSAPPRRSSNVGCRAAHRPTCCQSRKRRPQVVPDPQPISAGRYSHGSPVLSTSTMPVSAARADTGGRPPLGRDGSGGSKCAVNAQESSGRRGLAMPLRSVANYPGSRFC